MRNTWQFWFLRLCNRISATIRLPVSQSPRLPFRRHRQLLFESCEPRWMLTGGLPLHNALLPADTNADTIVSPVDLLLVVNALNGQPSATETTIYLDVNNDGQLALDDYYAELAALETLSVEPLGILQDTDTPSPRVRQAQLVP